MKIKRLYEAGEISFDTGDKRKEDKNKKILIKLIQKRLEELKALGDAVVFAVSGLDTENGEASAERVEEFKPLTQAIDNDTENLTTLLDENNLGKEEIKDTTLEENNELLREIYKLKGSIEEPLFKGDVTKADLNTFNNIKNELTEKIKEEAEISDYIKTLLEGTATGDASKEEVEQGPSKGQGWMDYILRAKEKGNEDAAWEYYFTKVWGDDASIIKGIEKPFKIEAFTYGLDPFNMEYGTVTGGTKRGNPFITLLEILKEEVPGAFQKIKFANYGYIHNAVIKHLLTEYDVAGCNYENGKLTYGHVQLFEHNNIIYKEDFYNYSGKTLEEYLELQDAILERDGIDSSVLYSDDKQTKLIKPDLILNVRYELGLDIKKEVTKDSISALVSKLVKNKDQEAIKKILKYYIQTYLVDSETLYTDFINKFKDSSEITKLMNDNSYILPLKDTFKVKGEINKLSLTVDSQRIAIGIALAKQAGYALKTAEDAEK